MRTNAGLLLAALLAVGLLAPARGQTPVVSSLSPDGTIIWTNTSTNCVAVVEEYSPATSGQWVTVYAEVPTTLVSSTQLTVTNAEARFRVVNADNSDAPEGMVLIPAGTNIGRNPLGEGESHLVCSYKGNYPAMYSLAVSPFYMDRFEVTRERWEEVAAWAYPRGYYIGPRSGWGKDADHPFNYMTWYACAIFCNALTEYENETLGANRSFAYFTDSGKTNVYKTGELDIDDDCVDWNNGYRLPTEEEWEYAARGGFAGRRFPWGDTISHDQANYYAQDEAEYDLSSGGGHPSYTGGGVPYTSPVGSFAANGYGLFDMTGNVSEWCWDVHECVPGARTQRGGSWYYFALAGRVGYRGPHTMEGESYFLGFRVVLPAGQ